MPLLALDLEPKSRSAPRIERGPPIRLRVGFDNVGRGLFPLQGLLGSLLLHGVLALLVILGPVYLGELLPAAQPVVKEAEEVSDSTQVVYLPRLGGGSQGNGTPGGGPEVRRKGVDTVPAGGTHGISYPGSQVIVSNPPQPTNRIQTILQPALKNPRILPPLIPLPNIVQRANATPLPSVAEQAQPARPAMRVAELQAPVPVQPPQKTADLITPVVPAPATPAAELPKLSIPSGPARPPVSMAMNAPVLSARLPDTQRDPTPPALFSPVPTQGTDLQNLVTLSPMPSPAQPAPQVPAGEARGTFAISPGSPRPSSQEEEAGSSLSATRGAAPALGDQIYAPPGNAASEGPTGSNAGDGLPIGGKGGEGTSTGKGVGTGNGGTGTDRGRGSATGVGVGSGPGNSGGSGTNGGAAHGSGAFPGITIQGGPSASAGLDVTAPTNAIFRVISPPHIQGNSLVISTGATGGGGLGVYQALQCGRIYTIFVPMPMGNWTLQYCQQQDASQTKPSASVNTRIIQSQEDLIPPDPVDKFDFRRAPLPADRARKTLIIKGIVREDGVVDKLEIYQGVLKEMDETALAALSKWKFAPATRGGKSVAVQILVGIQLSGPVGH